MAKKKSTKKPTERFLRECKATKKFLKAAQKSRAFTDAHESWAHDYAIIRTYREFEQMLLECLIAGLNKDTAALSESQGFDFPKNLTDEVCEYLILGGGYFDFKGRKDIRKKSKKFLGEQHFLTRILTKTNYDDAIRKLIALRNFAAHESQKSKHEALMATNRKKLGSAGSYLKLQDRAINLIDKLSDLATEIHDAADY